MSQLIRTRRGRVAAAIGASLVAGAMAQAQMANAPTNDAPNPYTTIENHFKLPAGRTWGSTSAVDIDKDGKIDLGRRALRGQYLLGSRQERDVAAAGDPEVRRVGQAGARASAPASPCFRTGSTSIATATCGSPTATTTCRAGRRARRRTRRCRRCRPRSSATRCSSSAPTASCCSRSASPVATSPGSRPIQGRSTSPTTSSPIRTATSSWPKATATPRRRRRGSSASTRAASSCASSARWAPARRASSCSRTAWRSTRAAVCSSPTGRTTASRSSTPRPTRRSTPGTSSAG